MSRIVSVLGCLLLVPAFLYFIGFISLAGNLVYSIALDGVSNDPRLIAGGISSHVVRQVQNLLVLMPGIVICSFATYKYKMYKNDLYRKYIKSVGVLLILTLPVLSIAGIYVLKLGANRA